jgi:uncharacterized membrane protein
MPARRDTMKVFKVYIIESNDTSNELETTYNVEAPTWRNAVEKAIIAFNDGIVNADTTSLNISVSINPTTELYIINTPKK